MRLRIRIGLILLLAMLQGIAPMLHAHVGHEQAESAAFHFHIVAPGSNAGAPRYDDATRRDSGAVIGVVDEMRQEAVFAVDHGGLCAVPTQPKSEHRRIAVPCVSPWRISTARSFVLPLAQAPPAVLR